MELLRGARSCWRYRDWWGGCGGLWRPAAAHLADEDGRKRNIPVAKLYSRIPVSDSGSDVMENPLIDRRYSPSQAQSRKVGLRGS